MEEWVRLAGFCVLIVAGPTHAELTDLVHRKEEK
jgi:hypothetical protein